MTKYLSHGNLKCIVNTFVISRLNYCNSIILSLSIINCSEFRTLRRDWLLELSEKKTLLLPSRTCTGLFFKILLLTYKALNYHSPTYFTSLFNAYKPARSLRSSGQLLLQVPDVKTCTYDQRSFSFYATKLWNDLPFYIKQSESIAIFKKNLKTFLFCNSF